VTRARTDRHVTWDGCFNVRDLGGLPTVDGRRTSWGAIVRADGLVRLSTAGWDALWAHGVRTIVDLRNDDELVKMPDLAPRPAGLITVHVPLDDSADTAFWEYCWSNELDGTSLYYPLFLERKPERCAAALAAIARAEPGGVAFHCGAGRDRTGLISLLLLALVGVEPETIVADYELSNPRLGPLWAAHGLPDQGPMVEAILKRRNTTARALILDILASLDAGAYLLAAGLNEDDLTAIRARLLGPADGRTVQP
jgi:protein-tyrosine phosphatase